MRRKLASYRNCLHKHLCRDGCIAPILQRFELLFKFFGRDVIATVDRRNINVMEEQDRNSDIPRSLDDPCWRGSWRIVTVGSGVSVHLAVSVAEAAAIRGRERGSFVPVGMSVARGVTTVPVQAVKKNNTPIKIFI